MNLVFRKELSWGCTAVQSSFCSQALGYTRTICKHGLDVRRPHYTGNTFSTAVVRQYSRMARLLSGIQDLCCATERTHLESRRALSLQRLCSCSIVCDLAVLLGSVLYDEGRLESGCAQRPRIQLKIAGILTTFVMALVRVAPIRGDAWQGPA